MATIKNPTPAKSSFPVIHQITAATTKAGRKARRKPATQMINAPIIMRMINPTIEYGIKNDIRFMSIIHPIENSTINDNLSVIEKMLNMSIYSCNLSNFSALLAISNQKGSFINWFYRKTALSFIQANLSKAHS